MWRFLKISDDLERRLRIIESSYGRDQGWIVEYRGRPVAVLHDPGWSDMFWSWYRIEETTDAPDALARLRSREFWSSRDCAFRSRGFPEEVVTTAFGHRYQPDDDEVNMRALDITIQPPTWWESIRCWRRLWRARRRLESGAGMRPASGSR